LTALASATAAGEAVVTVDGAAVPAAAERAASESSSWVLNSAPSIPTAGVAAGVPECAPVEAWVLMVAIAFRMSPPLVEWSVGRPMWPPLLVYRSPPGET
jgi:hypothetical protein